MGTSGQLATGSQPGHDGQHLMYGNGSGNLRQLDG